MIKPGFQQGFFARTCMTRKALPRPDIGFKDMTLAAEAILFRILPGKAGKFRLNFDAPESRARQPMQRTISSRTDPRTDI